MYRKIPKISPGAYIFQMIFLSRAYFWRGFIYSGAGGGGGAYIRREICASKSARLMLGGKFVSQNRLG